MNVAIIGYGGLGRAIECGLKKVGHFSIHVHAHRFEEFSREVLNADVILICVKPHDIKTVLNKLADGAINAVVVSCAAGLSISALEGGNDLAIVRAMPNTAVALLMGTTGLFYGTRARHDKLVAELFGTLGSVCVLEDESDFHALTALSGSGPAFVLRFAEAMINEGVTQGLSAVQSRQLTVGALSAAAALLSDDKLSIDELVSQIASKGGVTAAGLLEPSVSSAIKAACRRSKEIALMGDAI